MVKAPLKLAEIEEKASEILKDHGLYSVPVDPVTLANKMGIKVNNAIFSDTNLTGLITKHGNNVSILVNQSDPPYRKRFTIAHELGHHFLHLEDDGEFIDKSINLFRDRESEAGTQIEEIQANQFAAALLMPAELVRWYYQRENHDIEVLARIFNVSSESMGYRIDRLIKP